MFFFSSARMYFYPTPNSIATVLTFLPLSSFLKLGPISSFPWTRWFVFILLKTTFYWAQVSWRISQNLGADLINKTTLKVNKQHNKSKHKLNNQAKLRWRSWLTVGKRWLTESSILVCQEYWIIQKRWLFGVIGHHIFLERYGN